MQLFMKNTLSGLTFPQKSPVSPQKNPIFPQKSPISAQIHLAAAEDECDSILLAALQEKYSLQFHISAKEPYMHYISAKEP